MAQPAGSSDSDGLPAKDLTAGSVVMCNHKDSGGKRNLPLNQTNPKLAAEMVDQSLADRLSKSSGEVVLWNCRVDIRHIYSTTVRQRAISGVGCNICAGKVVVPGVNDLASAFPEISSQLVDKAIGSTVTPKSKIKQKWRCQKGHEWEASVCDRTLSKSGCPYCSGNMVIPGETDMATTHPSLAAELVDTDPTTVKAGTSKKLKWKCQSGHEWQAVGASRAAGRGCPVCARKKVAGGYNDMLTTHPDIAKQLVGADPTILLTGTMKKLRWRCDKGHEWIATGNDRLTGYGCPCCSGLKVWPGYNDMLTTHPHLASQLVDADPTTVMAGTNKKLKWRCENGHEWAATGNARCCGNGCSVCANRTVVAGINDMATLRPDLARELVGDDPSKVAPGTSKKLKWRCDNGHEWRASGTDRTHAGNGCPYCTNKAVLKGYNDMATIRPDLAESLVGTDPTTIVAGTAKKLRWRCSLGHEWMAKGSDRHFKKSTCPYCAFKRLLSGFNCMATTHPELARMLVDCDPKTIMAGSKVKQKWRCEKGHEWVAPPSRLWSGNGCPGCASSGFDQTKGGIIYLVSMPGRFKIGIMNDGTARLRVHEYNGWELVDSISGSGLGIAGLELAIKQHLRHNRIFTGKKAFREPFDGWTEAWNSVDLTASSICELCKVLGVDLDHYLATKTSTS